MLEMVKYGVATAGCCPIVGTSQRDGIEEFEEVMHIAKEKFEPLLEKSITYIKDKIDPDLGLNDANEEHSANREALEGTDLPLQAIFLTKRPS
ncbi:hypothetical protein BGX28_009762 [Mortierella sp. GBA30]|nr:hypothetical protein BGX28_009762 [Mortierella sp. GBA30]